jgi:hypothetical protein
MRIDGIFISAEKLGHLRNSVLLIIIEVNDILVLLGE